MKVSGSHTLRGTKQQVWDALQDPEVLVRTLPGCRRLEETGTDQYTVTVEAGVASIKGVYDGRVALSDQDAPNSYTLKASGAGGPGTIDATAKVTLEDAGDGQTRVSYDADAIVGGTVAGVGQRVLAGAAKRNAAAFFEAVDRVLAGEEPVVEEAAPRPTEVGPPEAAPEEAVPERAEAPAGRPAGRVFEAPPRPPSPAGDPKLLLAAGLLGALIALLGVIVGRRGARP